METDILIFSGQSNMQGQTECLPEPNEPVEGAMEYRLAGDELIPLRHPCGEDVDGGLLLGAHQGHGCPVPDCCRVYVQATGRRVVAIHAARGATTVGEWQKGTPRYETLVRKVRAGIEKAKTVGEIGRIWLLWLQGESDAIDYTAGEDYAHRLIAFKNDLKRDVGITRFGIIQVGYFCCVVPWLGDRTQQEGQACDETIMRAQERVAAQDPDFVMLTRICPQISRDPQYLNPFEAGHYNNSGMALIGEAAGKALAELQKQE